MANVLKIRIDKEFTDDWNIETVKNAVESFKHAYTINDLLREFCEQTNSSEVWGGDIIQYKITAFRNWSCDATYAVEMVIDDITRIYKVRFYIDHEGQVDTDPLLYDVMVFKAA